MAILVWLALLTSMAPAPRREDQPLWRREAILDRRYYGVLADILPPFIEESSPITVGEYEAWLRRQPAPAPPPVEVITTIPRKRPSK